MEQATSAWTCSNSIAEEARKFIQYLPPNFDWVKYSQSIKTINLLSRQDAIAHYLLNKNSYSYDLLHTKLFYQKYTTPQIQDMAVCISYFNAGNFKKPLFNLLTVTEDLKLANIPYFVIELLYPGQTSSAPDPHMIVNADSYMFHKENLWNILANKLPYSYNKLLFLDADIRFNKPNWYNEARELLETNDIIQPMSQCYWSHRNFIKKSVAFGIKNNESLSVESHHFGFSVGMTREFFDQHNFFDKALIGGGDVCFWLSLIKEESQVDLKDISNIKTKYKYPINNNKKDIKVDYIPDCIAMHLDHGSLENRKYKDRIGLIPNTKNIVVKNKDNVYEWKNKKYNKKTYKYFIDRKEDGNNIDVILSRINKVNINDIPPIQCINLRRATERKQHITDTWIKNKKMHIEFFDAFDKLTIDYNNLPISYDNDRCIEICQRSMSDGEIACAISHLLCYKNALNKYPNAPIYIFMEDDIYSTFYDKNHFYELLLFGFFERENTEVMLMHNPVVRPTYINIGMFSSIITWPIWGNQLTCFSKNGLQKIINTFSKIFCPLDWAWRLWEPSNGVCLLNHNLAQHDNSNMSTTYIGNTYRVVSRIEM